jgi:hypothetical protein
MLRGSAAPCSTMGQGNAWLLVPWMVPEQASRVKSVGIGGREWSRRRGVRLTPIFPRVVPATSQSPATVRGAVPDLELRLQTMHGTAGHIEPDIARERVAIVRQGSGVGVALEDAIPLARWEADH